MKKICFLIFCFFIYFPVFSQNPAYEEKYQAGRSYEEEGNYFDALISYYEAMLLEPTNKSIHILKRYNALADSIRTGNPFGQELNDFDFHDKWQELSNKYFNYWKIHCPKQFNFVVIPDRFSYSVSCYSVYFPQFLDLAEIFETGYSKAKNNYWTDIQSNWKLDTHYYISYKLSNKITNFSEEKIDVVNSTGSYMGIEEICLLQNTDEVSIICTKLESNSSESRYDNLTEHKIENLVYYINGIDCFIKNPKPSIKNYEKIRQNIAKETEKKARIKDYVSKNLKMIELNGNYYKKDMYCGHIQMTKTEITQKLYKMVTGKNPSQHSTEDLFPVDSVSNIDAFLFCNELSELYGYKPCYFRYDGRDGFMLDLNANGFRLPTTEEWFYAAYERETFLQNHHNRVVNMESWNEENSDNTIHKVATRHANSKGFFDILGNTWELCHNQNYEYRVQYRGGDYKTESPDENIFLTGEYPKTISYDDTAVGLRIVRNLF